MKTITPIRRVITQEKTLAIKLIQPTIDERAMAAAAETMRSGWVGMGPKVAEFEAAFSDYIGIGAELTAVAVNSCTAAMHVALRMLNLKPGTEVITTAMTFVATNQVLLWDQLVPVFVDIDPLTGNIDPAAVAAKITPKTGAIMVVHFAGQPCDLDALNAISARTGVPVIEDCAHACGGWHGGKRIGASGNWCAFSFGPTKALTTIDGGMLIVPAAYGEQARTFRVLGQSSDIFKRVKDVGDTGRFWEYDVTSVGRRYHMNDVSASIGLAHLPLLDKANARRGEIAGMYNQWLEGIPGVRMLKQNSASRSSHYMYVILAENRDRLAESLQKKGVTVGVHYKPNTLFPIFEHTPLPATEAFFARTLSLPAYPELKDEEVAAVVKAIRQGW